MEGERGEYMRNELLPFLLCLPLRARSCPTCAFLLHTPRSRKFVEKQRKTSVDWLSWYGGSHDNELDNDETWCVPVWFTQCLFF